MSISNPFPKYIPFLTSKFLVSPTKRSTNSTAWIKVKEIRIRKSGTYRISFYLYIGDAAYTAYGQIFKNGVAYGTLRSTNSTGPVYFIEDLNFSYGDLFQLYIRTSYGVYYAYTGNLKFLGILDFFDSLLD